VSWERVEEREDAAVFGVQCLYSRDPGTNYG
jgi:hypothetical protein